MDGERRKRQRRRLCLALALALLFVIPGVFPVYGAQTTGTKMAVDYKDSCSLTIVPPRDTEGTQGMAEDLRTANIVVDVYKLADVAAPANTGDYEFQFKAGYEELSNIYKGLAQDTQKDNWRELADAAARIALVEPGMTASFEAWELEQELELGTEGWGLYLLIPRGSDIEEDDYITQVTDEENRDWIATRAYSREYTYTFAPMMIFAPYKEGGNTAWGITDEDGNYGHNPWIPNPQISLKPEQDPRYGSLDIVKNLLSYERGGQAAFVFEVKTLLDGEESIRYVSIVFDDNPGQKHVLLEDVPIGATVTVTEVYSGASYEVVTDKSQTVTIEADKVAEVAFTNDYNEERKSGGSLTNRFTYTEGNGWAWEQLPDSQKDKEGI